jgi:predicted Zn-dependent protease with MMP-like domain
MRFRRSTIEKAIDDALARMPLSLRSKIENVEILLEDWPDGEVQKEMGLSSREDLLGLYRGVPRPERSSFSPGGLPDTITIYQGPIESLCTNEREMRRLVKSVLYHEIGHYYGFSEEELLRLETK